ncbi:hypothetical protein [Mycolicibacterium hippocampi]|uniref:YrhK domain-containing protein n=1 Tax=Mycolicibacterium hippocampi TaxID=659824 RepID=A0A7I9ZP45_9MYCO|nr:hypothetical protein [Mycolicibacterium hippocampi]GFH02426.1 hypothetical protein MHIP_29090 [Mycolicibacterium hippocampi]
MFAVATVPGFPAWAGAGAANVLCFVGSWFFTTAAWMQLISTRQPGPHSRASDAESASAAVQFAGTLLFNLSTGAAVWAHAVSAQRRYVWAPDATGSIAFLLSGVLAMAAVAATVGVFELRSRAWWAAAVNLIGCVAFGVSAVAAFVRVSGLTADERLANLGTFIGALCFLTAAVVSLPRKPPAQRESPSTGTARTPRR